MFADPISATFLTADGAKSCARVSIKDTSSVYRSADGKNTVRISHQDSKGRRRSLVRFENFTGVYTDSLTGSSVKPGTHAYLVIDAPSKQLYADSADATGDVVKYLISWLSASTNANLIKVLGGEI